MKSQTKIILWTVAAIFAMALLITILVYVIINNQDIADNKRIIESTIEAAIGSAWLFFIGSDDTSTVTVTGTVGNARLITIDLPTATSAFHMFSNIPQHISFDAGNMTSAELMWKGWSGDPVPTDGFTEEQVAAVNGMINNRDAPFIDEQPNATVAFTQTGTPISHIDTIVKVLAIGSSGGTTSLSCEILTGEKLVPDGTYEYVSITVDDFWDVLGAIGAVGGAFIACTAVEVGTAGVATALCGASIVGATAAYGEAIDG